jgi:S1-C subfamily serine protease
MDPEPRFGLVTGQNIVFGDRVFATTYLRSNIPIYGGESGSPVLDADGNLCGLLIASIPELQSSFIIPERALVRIVRDIIEQKNVKYCAAGFSVRGKMAEGGGKEVTISEIDEKKVRYEGTEVLQIGDTIQFIDGQKINEERDIADILFFKRPDDRLNFQVIRNKKTIAVAIKLSEKNY